MISREKEHTSNKNSPQTDKPQTKTMLLRPLLSTLFFFEVKAIKIKVSFFHSILACAHCHVTRILTSCPLNVT